MLRPRIIILFALVVLLSGCATMGPKMGLNTVTNVNQLRPGMMFPEVLQILGEPKSSVFTEDEWQVNYTFHEYWKGWVPYVLVFDKDTQRLKSWKADEEAYQRNQEKWMQIVQSLEQQQAYGGGPQQGGSCAGSGYGDSGVVFPSYGGSADAGYSEPSQFELDSAGYPGGAYENPSSGYYDYNYYE
jgi:outer membrane protein assembly factor BamE (lipoprotein component of BamABCDE complex)